MTYSWKGVTEKGPKEGGGDPYNSRIQTAGHPMSSRGLTQSSSRRDEFSSLNLKYLLLTLYSSFPVLIVW